MGCDGGCGETIQGICDCCSLVDDDNRFKLVTKCEECGAYLCADCKRKWMKRGKAMILDKTDKILKYLDKIKNRILK